MSTADVRVQLREDTAAAWLEADPVLSAGEIGVETDTGRLKAGDGVRPWSAIAYVGQNLNYGLDGGTFSGAAQPEPVIEIEVAQPPVQSTAYEGSVEFSVSATASNGAALAYQWQRQDVGGGDFVDIPGATGATLSLTGLTASDDGDFFRVRITLSGAAAPYVSDPVRLIVSSDPPPQPEPEPPTPLAVSVSGPSSVGKANNASITFTATASGGTGEYAYAWSIDGEATPGDQASLAVQGASLASGQHSVSCAVTSGEEQLASSPVSFTVVDDRSLEPVFSWQVAPADFTRASALVQGLRLGVTDTCSYQQCGNQFPAARNLDPDNLNYCAFPIGDGMFICLPARADFTLPVLRKGFVGTGAVYQNTGVSASGVSHVTISGGDGGPRNTINHQVQVFRQGSVVVVAKNFDADFQNSYCLVSSDTGRTFKIAPFNAMEIRNVAIGRSHTNGQDILVALFRNLGGLSSSVKWTADLQNFDGWQDPSEFSETPPIDGMYLAGGDFGFLLETQSRFNSTTDEQQYLSPGGVP